MRPNMTISQFRQLAAYNRWANARLYAAALDVSDQGYRLHIGVAFGSLHGTLNHLLLTDRLWLKRLTGEGDHPDRLDAILYEDRAELTRARIDEDNRLLAVIDQYDEATLDSLHGYKTSIRDAAVSGPRGYSVAPIQSPDSSSWTSPCVLIDLDG